MKRHFATGPLLSLILFVSFATLLVSSSGCDFARVDEGADVSLDTHLRALAQVTTTEAAEQEIQRFFNKAKIGLDWELDQDKYPYASYVLSKDMLRQTATAQARFNQGDPQYATSIEQTFKLVLAMRSHVDKITDQTVFKINPTRPISVELEDVLMALKAKGRRALADPEAPENTLILGIITQNGVLPEEVPEFTADYKLSPIQRHLFGLWLDQEGPDLPFLSAVEGTGKGGGNPNGSCPAGTELIAKFEWSGGKYKFEKGDPNAITIESQSTRNEVYWKSNGVGIYTIIVKGATDTHDYDYSSEGGITSGKVTNKYLKTPNGKNNPDISNIQFCGKPKPPPPPPSENCYLDCWKEFVGCLFSQCYCPCEGKITKLVLQYVGEGTNKSVTADILSPFPVQNIASATLSKNETITIDGTGRAGNPGFAGTLGNEVVIKVDGVTNAQFHTSCSDPRVVPGYQVNDFLVVSVTSKDGGTCGLNCWEDLKDCLDGCHNQGRGK
jgi:hypothetical protein